jgi:acyl-coenzyme A thioesterase PaaI-like protein
MGKPDQEIAWPEAGMAPNEIPAMDSMRHPALFRRAMNLWPPFLGAGIWVQHISGDWRYVVVTLTRRWYNRNAMGTHFGGSLFAMTDPFYMLMLIQNLGKHYSVWDQSARVEFVKPVKERVQAVFDLDQGRIDRIVRRAADGEKHFEDFSIDVMDAGRTVVAKVTKTIYVRRKGTPRIRELPEGQGTSDRP